jgi:hypothetical protein
MMKCIRNVLGLATLGLALGGSGVVGSDVTVTIDVLADNFGGEISWQIVSSCDGSVVASENQFSNAILHTHTVTVPGGSTFTIFDSFGDGLCCGFGDGQVTLTLCTGVVIADHNGDYGASHSVVLPGTCTDPPTQCPTVATDSPTQAPTQSPTTPCSNFALAIIIEEAQAVCPPTSGTGKGKGKGNSSAAECYADDLGDAVVDAFAVSAATTHNLPAPVGGIEIAFDDVHDDVTVIGADGPGTGTRIVTVELAFKPESPLNPADYAAAASAWQAAGSFPLSVDVCGCTTSFTVTDTASGYDIEPAALSSGKTASSSGKKAKKCKGAFTPPKSGKAETVRRRREVGATSVASTTSVATVGVAAVVVAAVGVVLVGIKRRLRSPTLATAAPATDSSLRSTMV